MGEWSEYFEDFPEENSANWINGRFDPQEAKRIRELECRQEAIKKKANAKHDALVAKSKRETKARSLLVTEDCPQCGLKELTHIRLATNFIYVNARTAVFTVKG